MLGRHTEAFEVDYDPSTLSYEDVLVRFFNAHSASPGAPRQYRSAVFYRTPEEKATAERVRARFQPKSPYGTDIEPLDKTTFWLAEDYHQKYILRHSSLFSLLQGLSDEELISEPIVTKLSGLTSRRLEQAAFVAQLATIPIPARLRQSLATYGLDVATLHFVDQLTLRVAPAPIADGQAA